MLRGHGRRFRISLRYKLALPVSVFVFVILLLPTHATIGLVRDFVVASFESRILSETQLHGKSLQPVFVVRDFKSLQSLLDQIAANPEIYGIRVVDFEGSVLAQSPLFRELPNLTGPFVGTIALFPSQSLTPIILGLDHVLEERVDTAFPPLYLAAAALKVEGREVGRVETFYMTKGMNETVRKIYQQRMLFSFLAALGMALLTSAVTWLAIRPLFRLGKTVQDILRGETGARAKIRSGDEIEELAEAFNEMVERLERSLKNLRARTEALEESEEKYRALVEHASDVIWLLSPEGKIIFMNQGFSGLARETILREGLPLLLSFHTEDSVARFKAAFEQVKNAKTTVSHLTTVHHDPKSKAEIYYSTNLTPVLGRMGELKAIQALSRDVTEVKRIELMKDHLIRDVAHELKTPVAKFEMTLDWFERELAQTKEKNRYQRILDLMKRNADLLMTIITGIMDLSRLESGAEQPVRRPCDLGALLKRVLEDYEPLVTQKKLILESWLNGGSFPFEGDEAMLYRLFSNLLSNAMKFTPEGKIRVLSEKTSDSFRVKVEDTGIGLEKEDLHRVFDRFFQKTPATSGMGVGLALAKEIALLHGGTIWAESPGPGRGSTFIVEFQR